MLFQDRTAAGKALARKLVAYANRKDTLVLGLPRGGIPVAFEVAKALNAPLDAFLVRKLGVPGQEELAMGAIASGGVRVLNEDIVRSLRLSDAVIDNVIAKEQREIERREQLYRQDRPLTVVSDRIVILVDDGLATGATMRAAVRAIEQQQPSQIVVAVPVSSPEAYRELSTGVDEIICVEIPQPFNSVGLWYDNFPQTPDEEVCDLLQQAATQLGNQVVSSQ